MKVRSSRKSSKQSIKKVFISITTIVVIGLVVPVIFTVIGQIVLYPIYATQTWFRESTTSFPTFFREKKVLLEDIERLESELALTASSDATQQRLRQENTWLRNLLGLKEQERIAAAVTARPNQLPYDFLQIDQGNEAGIQVGAPVYVGSDNVIGVVVETAKTYAFVELFTTPGFTATVYVGGANIIATLEGYGGGVARVRVPQGIPLTVGNVVHVPSIQPGVFGKIAYIENRPTQPEQYGYVTLDKPIANINYVAVGAEPLVPATESLVREGIDDIIERSLLVESLQNEIASSTASTTASSTATTTDTI